MVQKKRGLFLTKSGVFRGENFCVFFCDIIACLGYVRAINLPFKLFLKAVIHIGRCYESIIFVRGQKIR